MKNPLCKVPTLMLECGALYDSRVIIAYLNDVFGAEIIPLGAERWDALRREALGDGLAEAVIRRFVERLGPANERTDKVAARQEKAIAATLDHLEQDLSMYGGGIDVGHVAVGVALDYLSTRSPEIDWLPGRPALARWFADFQGRPSALAVLESEIRSSSPARAEPAAAISGPGSALPSRRFGQ